MTTQRTVLVIFGISGDLSTRKLLPSLAKLAGVGLLGDTKILGVSRRSLDVAELLRIRGDNPDPGRLAVQAAMEIVTLDVAEVSEYARLKDKIEQQGSDAQVILYLSVPPVATIPIVERLGEAGLNGPRYKLLLEKPFGVDLESAEEAIARVADYFDEDQVYRIDHYLAKEMAQNIIAFRSRNAIFRNLWHADFIEKIDIIASEKIGVEGRAVFYEQTGALRDFVQNHLMQLMALVLMDVSKGFEMKDLPEKRRAVLEDIIPIPMDKFEDLAIRGQYDTYQKEVDNPGSETETFVSLTLESNHERWKGVPIRLATGKKLADRSTEIRVYFKKTHVAESNQLVLYIQPKEGIEIELWAKKPGYEKSYEKMSLQFDYHQPAGTPVDAYERVLLDAISSDKSLFACADEVLASWRILQPVQSRWDFQDEGPMIYRSGTPINELIGQEL